MREKFAIGDSSIGVGEVGVVRRSDIVMFFISLSLLSVLLSLGVCIYSIYNNNIQRSGYLNLLNLAILIALLGNYVEVVNLTAASSMIGVHVAYLGEPFIPVLWYLCILEFCGVTRTRNQVLGLLLIPLLMTYLVFTWETNHLLFSASHYRFENEFGKLHFDSGPLYFIKPSYFFLLIGAGVFTVISKYKGGTRRFKQQGIYFLISALIPVFTVSNYIVETDRSLFDITPYGLAVTSLLFMLVHSRYGLSNYADAIKNNVIKGLREGIIIFDPDGIHLDSNKMAQSIFPQLADILIGTSIKEMGYLPFDSAMIQGQDGRMLEYVNVVDDLPRTYNLSVSCIKNDIQKKIQIIGYCIVIHNITPLKKVLGELEKRAYMDPLTGIFNRAYFFEKANYYMVEGFLSQEPFSVIMFDLDHFKSVNDTYGHAGGDFVLMEVAALAKSLLRKTDILGRYGGEEFCIALPHTKLSDAIAKAEEIRRGVCRRSFEFEGRVIPLTVSLGVTVARYEVDGNTIGNIVKRADVHLYDAKRQGEVARVVNTK